MVEFSGNSPRWGQRCFWQLGRFVSSVTPNATQNGLNNRENVLPLQRVFGQDLCPTGIGLVIQRLKLSGPCCFPSSAPPALDYQLCHHRLTLPHATRWRHHPESRVETALSRRKERLPPMPHFAKNTKLFPRSTPPPARRMPIRYFGLEQGHVPASKTIPGNRPGTTVDVFNHS